MGQQRYVKDSSGRSRERRARLRLGIGTAQALVTLAGALALTALLVYAFSVRWPALLDVIIGATWALVVGGLIIVPIVASFVSDMLSQFGRIKAVPPVPEPVVIPDEWEERKHIRRLPTDGGLGLRATTGPAARAPVQAGITGFDWEGFFVRIGSQLAIAVGDGFSTDAGKSSLTLRFGDQVRRVNLGSILQPPPLEVSDRALRACLKVMDEAQMFVMRVKHEPWPARGPEDPAGPTSLPRPRVRMDEGEVKMSWTDGYGVVLQLEPLALDGSNPSSFQAGPEAW